MACPSSILCVMRVVVDWDAVQRFVDEGGGRDAACVRFGFQPAAWYRAIGRGHLRAALNRKTIDWTAVQAYYDEGHTYRECRARFGFAAWSWTKAVNRGALRARARQKPLTVILRTSPHRCTIKRRLLDAGVLRNQCGECGLTEWRGKPISIQLDHVNGIRSDHRVEIFGCCAPISTVRRQRLGDETDLPSTIFPVDVIGNMADSDSALRGSSP